MCPPRFVKPASCSRARNGVRPGGNDRVEHDLGVARHDVVDELVVVHVVEREVLLAHDRAACGGHDLPHLLVQDMRPDVVGGRQVEALCAGALHEPREERVDLLRGHRSGAEDQRVALLALVLLGVDVERLALLDDGAFDRLTGRAVDAAEDDVDMRARRRAWLPPRRRPSSSVALSSMNSSTGWPSRPPAPVDVVDHHRGRVRVGDPHEGERPGLIGDDADPGGSAV